MIDTVHQLETPEGIDIEISPAGPVSRGLAVTIDSLIRNTLSTLLAAGLFELGQAGMGIALVGYFLIYWFYPVFFEVLRNGQTPGKQALGLRVVNEDGTPVGWSASILRNLLRTADALPLFYMAGVVSMLCTSRFQRLGDLAAGTLVIGVREVESRVDGPQVSGARLPPVALLPEEQYALLGFAERSGELSVARLVELADILTPLTGQRADAGAAELLRIANGIAGKR